MHRYLKKVERFIGHDAPVYLKRVGKALAGKSWDPKCCACFSLDGTTARTLGENLDRLVTKRENVFVVTKTETKEMRELVKLLKGYDDRAYSLDKKEYNKNYAKMFKLLERYFNKMRY